MKKGVLFLALLLSVSFGGCVEKNEDFKDTITSGTWRVGYYIARDDEDTSLFNGYVFTFLANGDVTVARPGAPTVQGFWNEFNNDTRLDLDFSTAGPLQRLDKSWVIDYVYDDEVQLHELGAPLNQLHFNLR